MATNAQEERGERWWGGVFENSADGTDRLSLTRSADTDSNTFFDTGFLKVECRSTGTGFWILWGNMSLGSEVTVRIDGVVRPNVVGYVGGRESGVTAAHRPIPLLREIVRADRLEVQASPANSGTVRTLVFDFSAPNDNTREVIERVARACQWTVE